MLFRTVTVENCTDSPKVLPFVQNFLETPISTNFRISFYVTENINSISLSQPFCFLTGEPYNLAELLTIHETIKWPFSYL